MAIARNSEGPQCKAQFDKWITGVKPDDFVHEAAQYSLRVRLAAVQHYLPLAAARADEDVEYVHQLRVYTRRSAAAMQLYADLLPKKPSRWFAKTLKKIRRAAGKARDLDVLMQNHESDTGTGAREFLADIRRRREAAQMPMVKISRKLKRNDRLRRHTEKLLKKTNKQQSDIRFDKWATSRLRRILKRFFKASPTDLQDLASLHRFRIRGKELRYATELLSPAFPAELRTELYPVIEQLQERLGQVHDHAVANARFAKWVAQTKNTKKASHVRNLLEQENFKLDIALGVFSSWWTPEFETLFRDSFTRLIEGSEPST